MFTAQSISDLPDQEALLSMSGLEFMQGVLDGKVPRPPISVGLNFDLLEVSPGKVVFGGAPTFDHTNPMGTVHGGWYGTVLDSAMACAVMTTVPKGSVYTTLEYKVNITRGIPLDRAVRVVGTVDHAGRRTGTSHGEIRDAETDKLYATGSTTCIIIKMT